MEDFKPHARIGKLEQFLFYRAAERQYFRHPIADPRGIVESLLVSTAAQAELREYFAQKFRAQRMLWTIDMHVVGKCQNFANDKAVFRGRR